MSKPVGPHDYFGREPSSVVLGVSVEPAEVESLGGQTIQFVAVVVGEGDFDPSVVWSSSDELVAAVDEGGLVTTDYAGSAVITATSVQDSLVSGSGVVSVFILV